LIYQFGYIFFFISLIFIICAIFIKNKKLKFLCITLFAVFIAIGFSELILTLKSKSAVEDTSSYPFADLLFIPHKFISYNRDIYVINKKDKQKRGYANRAPAIGETVFYDVICGTYCNGFRYTKNNPDSNENYIFLGCSFMFGAGLNDDQTLPYYFSKQMNFEKNVLNCSRSGSSINSAISILESDIISQLTSQDSHTEYIIYSMIHDHIYRNFRFSGGPSDNWQYRNNKWERVNPPFGVFNYIITRSRFFIKIYDKALCIYDRDYRENYMIKSLEHVRVIAKTKYKAKFIVIVWPDCWNNPLLIDKLKKTNLDMLFLPKNFNRIEYKIKGDGHPNEKANEEIADILFEFIKNRKSGK
jgi:hypothetical protein